MRAWNMHQIQTVSVGMERTAAAEDALASSTAAFHVVIYGV